MSHFLKGARGLKVKDFPGYVSNYAKEHLTYSKIAPRVQAGVQEYKVNYIDKGSAKPVWDVMLYGFILSYAISWPGEYRHLKAEEAAKLAGKPAH